MSVLLSSSFNREIEYLKKETQRCAQVGAEATLLKEESGQLQEQVHEVPSHTSVHIQSSRQVTHLAADMIHMQQLILQNAKKNADIKERIWSSWFQFGKHLLEHLFV